MKNYEFTDCEQVVLLDLITQCLANLVLDEATAKHKLPYTKGIDLTEVDIKVLRSLQLKLNAYLE